MAAVLLVAVQRLKLLPSPSIGGWGVYGITCCAFRTSCPRSVWLEKINTMEMSVGYFCNSNTGQHPAERLLRK